MLTTFLRRIAGAALLDAGTYEEVEADRTATPQAVLVVLLSSLAAGIGLNGSRGAAAALTFFAVASVLALATWTTFALITLRIGSRALASVDTSVDAGELLRTLGFAAAPGLCQVFALLSPAPHTARHPGESAEPKWPQVSRHLRGYPLIARPR
jgi:hypothetical protein